MNLSKEKIPSLIKKIAIPASVGFFFNTMYNVVDTYYAGLISTKALAALSISFPVFFIIIALGNGISTGATALISNSLGEKNKEKARIYTAQSISFGIILSFLLTILGISIAPFLFKLLGASGDYLSMALTYINIIFYGSLFFIMYFVLNSPLQAIGNTKTLRNALVIGFFLNVILDPWFIYGGFGIPAMGIAGVAVATILIEFLLSIYILIKVFQTDLINKNCLKCFIPKKREFLDIAKQGFPAGLNMMTVAIGIFIITYFVSWFGENAVAAYGIATRIEQIALLPTIGLNIAALTLVGHNNGAKLYGRIKETITDSLKYGIIILTFGMVIVFIFANQLMGFFTNNQDVINIGAPYLRIAVFIFYAYLFLFLNTSALQGMKKPMYALWIGLYRQVLGPILIFYFAAKWFGIYGLWYGVAIVTWSAAIITILYTRYVINKHTSQK